jgi:vesicle coat complex subunit
MACLRCQKHFSEHDESELFICINWIQNKFSEQSESIRQTTLRGLGSA